MSELLIVPQVWVTRYAPLPQGWWDTHGLGLQRVWPECAATVDRVAREVGVDPRLLVTRMELEQSAISYKWDGEDHTYAGGRVPSDCDAVLDESGVVGACGVAWPQDVMKLYYLCGVDKTDSGPRTGGWFGPERQLYGCALRFRYWYRGDDGARTVYDPIGEGLVNIYAERVPEWRNWLGLQDVAAYAPGVPVTRSGETIVPANQASADCLRYTTSLAGSRRLADIGRRWFAADYEAEERSESDRQVAERLQDAIREPSTSDPSSTRQVGETSVNRELRVCIDPGHGTMLPAGGRDTGTATTWGTPTIYEKDANLEIALAARDLLEDEGHDVMLTHNWSDYDETMSYSDRGRASVEWNADVFVSIHHDGGKTRGTHGFAHRTTYPNGMKLARLLAEAIQEEFGVPFSYGGPAGDWFGKSLGVLAGGNNAKITEAAALIECMFMAGPKAEPDVEIIRSHGYYHRAARAICRAIHRYAGNAIPKAWAVGYHPETLDSEEGFGVEHHEDGLGAIYVSRGDHGSAVAKVQTALNAHGAALDVDCDFGPLTYAAVVEFQREHDLVADGVVGPLTWAKLGVGA